MDIKKLLTRTISGIVYVAIIIFGIVYSSLTFNILTIVLTGLATLEFIKITQGLRYKNLWATVVTVVSSISLAMSAYIYPFLAWVILILIRMIMGLYNKEGESLKDLGIYFFSQLYIGLPFCMMTLFGEFYTRHIILLIFFFLWINDTGAYLVGTMMGRHRLFERISPKKSWEGFFGGLIFTIGAGVTFCYTCPNFFHIYHKLWVWISIAVLTTVFGTWGDLVESQIKRSLQIKDSGNIIPGHGGILDRIDSFLFALPAVAVFCIILSFVTLNYIY